MTMVRRFWNRLIWILTLSCEESSRLMSEGMDRELTFTERMALYGHLASCRSSRRFRRQLIGIRRYLNKTSSGELDAPSLREEALAFRLSSGARRRIRERLEEIAHRSA